MEVYAKDTKELGKALKDDVDEIAIEADLEKHILRFKAKGKVAWAAALGAITVTVVSILAAPATGGTSSLVSFAAAPAAVSILGASTATAAVSIAVAAGGVESLNKLRKYQIVKRNGKTVLIKR